MTCSNAAGARGTSAPWGDETFGPQDAFMQQAGHETGIGVSQDHGVSDEERRAPPTSWRAPAANKG
eukprot:4446403-Alexandrium_andersonii.AAC.1